MLHTPYNLRRTAIKVRAVMLCFTWLSLQFGKTLRALVYVYCWHRVLWPLCKIYCYNFRDNLPAFFYKHLITYTHIKLFYLVGVV